jgi:hypothetical protein
LGNLSNLIELKLDDNRLSGNIPPEVGNLANLEALVLGQNQLTGGMPTSVAELTKLSYASFVFNALYTNNSMLLIFLDTVAPGWQDTQTIAPGDVSASVLSSTSVEVSWSPIPYTADSGSYRVFYSTTSGGPYTLSGYTTDKTVSQLEVTGLAPGTPYYFVVQTRTEPHVGNQNTVDSEYSPEVSKTTETETRISGKVAIAIAGHNNLPVTNATVALEGTNHTTTTDSNGDFSLEDLLPGTYNLTIDSPDLVPINQQISLSEGQNLQVNLPLMTAFNRGDATGDNKMGLDDVIFILRLTCGGRQAD